MTDWDSILDKMDYEDQVKRDARFDEDPDRVARVSRAADATGLPVDAADRNLDEIEAEQRMSSLDLGKIFDEQPATGRLIRDNGAIAHDEIEDLRDTEERIGTASNLARTFGDRLSDIGSNVLQSFGTLAAPIEQSMEDYLGGVPSISISRDGIGFEMASAARSKEFSASRQLAGVLEDVDLGSETRFSWDELKQEPSLGNLAGYVGEAGAASLADMLVAMTGSIGLASYVAGRSQEMAEGRAENIYGRDVDATMLMEVLPAAIAEASLERIGGRSILDVGGVKTGGQAARAAGRALFREGATEFVQENIDYAATTAGTDVDMSLLEAADRGFAAMVAGAGMGAAIRGTTASIELAVSKVNRSTNEQVIIDEMMGIADRTKLKSRDLRAYQNYMQDLAQSYGIETVSIDADAEYFQANPDSPLLDNIVGDDVQMDVADFMSLDAETRQALRPDLRLQPDSSSQIELESFDTQADIQAMIETAQESVKEFTRAQEIYRQVADQLNATGAYGRFTSNLMAHLYPAYVVTKAKNEGLTVDEVWSQMGVSFQSLDGEPDGTSVQSPSGPGDILAEGGIPSEVADAQAKDAFITEYEPAETQTVPAGLDQVTSPEDVAHVFAPFRKHAQESMLGLVTDDSGKVLGVVRHSKGTLNSATVSPLEFIGALLNIEGATKVWLGHNHPAGDPTPSRADYQVTSLLEQLFEGTSLSLEGHIVVGRDGKAAHMQVGESYSDPIKATPAPRSDSTSILEHVIKRRGTGPTINSPQSAMAVVEQISSPNALLLLDNRSQVNGVVAMTKDEMLTLKEGGRVERILKAIGRANSNTMLVKTEFDGGDAAQNIISFMGMVDDHYRVIDWITQHKQGHYVSAMERNKMPSPRGYYSQSASLRRGTQTLRKYGLEPGKTHKTRDVAAALEARQRDKYGHIARDDRSPEALRKISKWMAEEVIFELEEATGASGVGWYSEKFQAALDTFGGAFPELKTDQNARDQLTALIAITSDGQKVVPNFAQAIDIYSNFRETGQFTTERGHIRQASINSNLARLQQLYDGRTPEEVREYLLAEDTVSSLRKAAAEKGLEFNTDYQAHMTLPRSALVFGPKLGAFYANLMGSDGYLTMDRWWTRTFNRYRGSLLQSVKGLEDNPTDAQGKRIGLARFKDIIGEPEMSDDQALSRAVDLRNSYEAKGFKRGTDAEKAANTIYKAAFENIEDAPFNSSDRTFMIDAVNAARKTLKRKGVEISVADIQAVLWYYEKRLYGELGARQTADISYEEAAQRVSEGYQSEGRSAQGGLAEGVSPGEDVFQEGQVDGTATEADAGTVRDGGELRGSPRVLEQPSGPDSRFGEPLSGLPTEYDVDGESRHFGAYLPAHAAAQRYADAVGLDYEPLSEYAALDRERATRIAQAFEEAEHRPDDPQVQAAYAAMIDETLAQYQAALDAGLTVDFIQDQDPYAGNPRKVMLDVYDNNHMWVYSTREGFGSDADFDPSGNPMLAETEFEISGQKALVNDIFRVVHDYFGHVKDGVGFRARGEENAWRSHASMYSPLALQAMTTETRGQNSWVNFGPYGETNRTASAEETVYADQKMTLLPEWVASEGLEFDQPSDSGPRGNISLFPDQSIIRLGLASDQSTFFHESGHLFLEMERRFAESPNATDRQKADFQTILNFLEVESADQIGTEQHEKFARAFESYIGEGKAPSLELRTAFRRFAQWIVRIYRTLTALDVELNDDIRGVMDRMLATEEQIERAAASYAFDMTAFDEESNGKEKAKETLRTKLIKAIKREKDRDWKVERSRIAERIEQELADEPVYQAMGILKDLPVDRESVVELLGVKNLQKVPQLRGMTIKDGENVDDAAQLLGYPSGQAMIDAIMSAPKLKDEAQNRAQQAMLEKHGDPMAEIESLADQAMHNEEMATQLLAELRALNPRQQKIDKAPIREYAKDYIGSLRTVEIKPLTFQRAEVKAARAYERALAEGDTELALQHKQNQILQFYLVREAMAAEKKIERMRKTLKGYQDREYRDTEVAPEYAQNLRTYARMYDFRKGQGSMQDMLLIESWVRSQIEDENQFIKPQVFDLVMIRLRDSLQAGEQFAMPSWRDMTLDEFSGVHDQAKHFRWLGGQMSDRARAQRKAEANRLAESIEAKSTREVVKPDVIRNLDRNKSIIKRFMADHLRLRNVVSILDGGTPGVAKAKLYDPLAEAANNEVDMNMALAKDVEALFKPLEAKLFRRGKSLRTVITESGKQWTLGLRERIMLTLYWGSKDSRQAIMDGHNVTEADVQRMMDNLSNEELDLVEGIWKLNDSLWPKFSAVTTRLYGAAPTKVTNESFSVRNREMPGGYMRLFYEYDPKDSSRADLHETAQDVFKGGTSISMSKPGSAHARVGSGGRRVNLELNNITMALEENVHSIAFGEVSRDVARLAKDKGVAAAIIKGHGEERYQALIDTLDGIVSGDLPGSTGIEKWMRYVRTNLTFGYLAFSIRNFVQQPVALTNVFGKVGEVRAVSAMLSVMRRPKYWMQFASERSTFMRHRLAFVNREAAEQLSHISTNSTNSWLKRHAFDLQTLGDSFVAYPAWVAGYRQGLEIYADEAKAISHADDIVAATVGSGMVKDLSPILMGGGGVGKRLGKEAVKQLTFMGSFFNVVYNLVDESYRKTNFKSPKQVAEFSREMAWYLVAPALLSKVVVSSLWGEDEDEGFWEWSAKAVGEYGLGSVFLLRDLASALNGFKPSVPFQSAPAGIARGVGEIGELIEEGEVNAEDVPAMIRSMQPLLPLPGSGQVARFLDYMNSHAEGNEGDFNIYDALVEGKERDK